MATEPLTHDDLVALAVLLNAADEGLRVRWVDPATQDVQEGVARCFAHDGGGSASGTDDVRDLNLHVSSTFERWLPVRDLIPMVHEGTFAVDRGAR